MDYFDILKEKQRFKLDKNEKKDKNDKNDKDIIRDLQLFGCYEFNEITDVIERHFILERCFTSYGLIKFSLLNVLAVTRGLKGQQINNRDVISTMCDFCEKTKSLVRKYMNIYLNIFNNIKVKGILEDDNECDECLNIITLYFKKTNMIPTEETTKAFTEIKETESKNASSRSSTSSSGQKERMGFKNLVDKKGKFFDFKKKKFDDIIKTIETIFSGTYKPSVVHLDYKDLEKLYDDIKTVKKDKFIPKTPLSLYSSTNKILSNYLKDFSNKPEIYSELGKDTLSLLYYFKLPVIGPKWIEQYKPEEKSKLERLSKDKSSKKGKENKIEEQKDKNEEEIEQILKNIIAILYDLIDVIRIEKKKHS